MGHELPCTGSRNALCMHHKYTHRRGKSQSADRQANVSTATRAGTHERSETPTPHTASVAGRLPHPWRLASRPATLTTPHQWTHTIHTKIHTYIHPSINSQGKCTQSRTYRLHHQTTHEKHPSTTTSRTSCPHVLVPMCSIHLSTQASRSKKLPSRTNGLPPPSHGSNYPTATQCSQTPGRDGTHTHRHKPLPHTEQTHTHAHTRPRTHE